MAVAGESRFRLSAGPHSLVVRAPAFFRTMLGASLLGWSVGRAGGESPVDVAVRFDNGRFATDSRILERPIERSDAVHALNDFFLALAYFYTRLNEDHRLIHCAAYSDGRETVLLLGDKKSGKSFLATRHGVTGGRLIADDLLLWNPSDGRFKALGLPPRLRRPVHADILERTAPDDFLAGRDLVYLKAGRYAGTPAGETVEIDRVRLFDAPREYRDARLVDYAREIRKREISESFWAIKRPDLDLASPG